MENSEKVNRYNEINEAEIQDDLIEEFKPVVGYEGFYEISNHGRLKSLKRKNVKFLIESLDKDGYNRKELYGNKFSKKEKVHRLVAIAFIPNPNNYPLVNHKNSIRNDNRVSNLEWCTNTMNVQHSIQQGNGIEGEKHHATKLTNALVLEIKKTIECSDLNYDEIGKTFNIEKHTVKSICNGWKHVYGSVSITARELKREKERNEIIRLEFSNGVSRKELKQKYNICKSTLYLILNNKQRADLK